MEVKKTTTNKKVIQIVTIILRILSVLSYIAIIKIGIAFVNQEMNIAGLLLVIIFAFVVQYAITTLKKKFPNTVNDADDIVYTKKELEERDAGVNKNPLFVKILLIIPATFGLLVVGATLYMLYLYLNGNL